MSKKLSIIEHRTWCKALENHS